MIKKNVFLKDAMSLADKAKMTTELADSYFVQDKVTGEWQYTPYFSDVNIITAFFLYCVDGLEFEQHQDENGNPVMESVYDAVMADEEVFRLYTEIVEAAQEEERVQFEAYEHKVLLTQFLSVLTDVADMVEFRKQQLLHQKRDSVDLFFSALTDALNKIDFSKLDLSQLASNLPVPKDSEPTSPEN